MITINPENPSSDNTVVFIFEGGSNCREASQTTVGSHYYFEMVPVESPLPCLSAPVPYEIQWNVGRLRAGDYQVTQIDQVVGTVTESFAVSEGVLPFPEPTIPAIGITGTIILAIGLAWITNKAFKKDALKRAS